MKSPRLAGPTLAAIVALSLVVASSAFAEPAFHPIGGTFTGLGLGPEKLTFGGQEVKCEHNITSGTISNATLAGGVVVTFTGCKSTGTGGSNCTLKSSSPVGAAGVIITNTLHGVLGLILPKGTGSGVGLLLLPVANGKFFTLESNKCTAATSVTGNIAGETNPVGGGLVSKGTLTFQAGTKGESIKDFDLSTGGLVRPELELFAAIGSLETNEDVTFSPAVEVS